MELGVKVHYLHSEIDTLERIGILRDLRLGYSTWWLGSTCYARGWTCRRYRWWLSLMPIKRASALGNGADPDYRPGRAACGGEGDHVRGCDDRLDAPGY